MDFGALPPEINSTRMYAGPGGGSMLAAAAAWDGLAADLQSTVSSYDLVVSGLTDGSWRGAASASMVAAATPYLTWMSATAVRCGSEQAGGRRSVRGGVRDDRATGHRRGQSGAAGGADRDESAGAEHPGDHGNRSSVRGDVGAGFRRNVRLRRRLGGRHHTDALHRAEVHHKPGGRQQPDVRGGAGRRRFCG